MKFIGLSLPKTDQYPLRWCVPGIFHLKPLLFSNAHQFIALVLKLNIGTEDDGMTSVDMYSVSHVWNKPNIVGIQKIIGFIVKCFLRTVTPRWVRESWSNIFHAFLRRGLLVHFYNLVESSIVHWIVRLYIFFICSVWFLIGFYRTAEFLLGIFEDIKDELSLFLHKTTCMFSGLSVIW